MPWRSTSFWARADGATTIATAPAPSTRACRRLTIVALLVARRQRLSPGMDDDVIIPLPPPIFELGFIDRTYGHDDAEPLELRLVEQGDPLEAGIFDQQLDAQWLAALDVGHL